MTTRWSVTVSDGKTQGTARTSTSPEVSFHSAAVTPTARWAARLDEAVGVDGREDRRRRRPAHRVVAGRDARLDPDRLPRRRGRRARAGGEARAPEQCGRSGHAPRAPTRRCRETGTSGAGKITPH